RLVSSCALYFVSRYNRAIGSWHEGNSRQARKPSRDRPAFETGEIEGRTRQTTEYRGGRPGGRHHEHDQGEDQEGSRASRRARRVKSRRLGGKREVRDACEGL